VRSGSTAPLSAFQVGDSVNASTTTQNGTVLDDMVSGTGAGGGAQGGTPPQQGTGAGTAGTGTDDS
jgi:hypothetical protein